MNKSFNYQKILFGTLIVLVVLFCIFISVPNLTKGLYSLNVWGKYLWFVSYENGFIKRGLIGSLFQMILADLETSQQFKIIVQLYSGFVFVFFTILFGHLFYLVFRLSAPASHKSYLLMLLCLLSISPLWPTLAYTTGYPDLFVFFCCYLGFLGYIHQNTVLLVLAIVIGMLIHGAFIFIWLTVLCLITYEVFNNSQYKGWSKSIFISFALPLVLYVVIGFFHNNEALNLTLNNIDFLTQHNKETLYKWQFNQSIGVAFQKMVLVIYRNLDLFIIKTIYFTFIPLLVYGAYFFASEKIKKTRFQNVFYFIAIFAPLSILLFAWDLSRLLSYATFSTALVLIYALKKNNFRLKPGIAKFYILSFLLFISVIVFANAPLMYSYMKSSAIVGKKQFQDSLGKTTAALIVENDFNSKYKNIDGDLVYSKNILPNELKRKGANICGVNLCDKNDTKNDKLVFRNYEVLYSGSYELILSYSSTKSKQAKIGYMQILANGNLLSDNKIYGTEGKNTTFKYIHKVKRGKYNSTIHLIDLYLVPSDTIEVESLTINKIK